MESARMRAPPLELEASGPPDWLYGNLRRFFFNSALTALLCRSTFFKALFRALMMLVIVSYCEVADTVVVPSF